VICSGKTNFSAVSTQAVPRNPHNPVPSDGPVRGVISEILSNQQEGYHLTIYHHGNSENRFESMGTLTMNSMKY